MLQQKVPGDDCLQNVPITFTPAHPPCRQANKHISCQPTAAWAWRGPSGQGAWGEGLGRPPEREQEDHPVPTANETGSWYRRWCVCPGKRFMFKH
jgi:hypothetical protein